jgi:hypothetical protein
MRHIHRSVLISSGKCFRQNVFASLLERMALTMTVMLETLELSPDELAICRDAVRKIAYFGWLDAGCPSNRELSFWVTAESQWIAHNYVPGRRLDGMRAAPNVGPSATPAITSEDEQPLPVRCEGDPQAPELPTAYARHAASMQAAAIARQCSRLPEW